MKILFVMMGPTASGKTTIASNMKGFHHISYLNSKDKIFDKLLKKGVDIVLDNYFEGSTKKQTQQNINKYISPFIKKAFDAGYVVTTVTTAPCYKRKSR